jgi:ribonuclease G
MRKEIIINSAINEVRVAITEDGHLAEFFVEFPEKEKSVGNVYYGKISKVATGINAAFVDIGKHQNAFLHFSDVNDTSSYGSFDSFDEDEQIDENIVEENTKAEKTDDEIETFEITNSDNDEKIEEKSSKKLSSIKLKKAEKIGQITKEFAIFSTKSSGDVVINLQPNKEVLVQVVREPYSHKGMKVTTKIAIPGRYVVMLPFEKMIGISRKIQSSNERRRLKRLAKNALPEGFGCIIRTASVGKNEEELIRDWEDLLNTWNEVEQKIEMARKTQTPMRVYQDMLLAASIIRDFFKKDIGRVVVDSSKMYNDIVNYLKITEPKLVEKVELYKGITPIFEALEIEKELERTNKRVLSLNNGGDIVIDRTEALTVVDVNSGKATETDQEKNALKTNIEAASEIAKQMRLRDIGGIIIIDFIDMQREENRNKLFNKMLNAVRFDRAKVVLFPLTQLGLMQITRQRINQNLVEKTSVSCPTCSGKGRIASNATLLNSIEKWLKNYTKKSNEFNINLIVHPKIAEFLTEGEFSIISKLMIKYFVKINVLQNDSIVVDKFRIVSVRKQKDITGDIS